MKTPFDAHPDASARADLERRLAEVTAHYEVARSLLGATEPDVIASRLLHSGLGILGARSGVLLIADGRDRFRVLFDTQQCAADDLAFRVPESAREWMLEQSAFPLAGAAAARGLGELRNTLRDDLEAEIGAAVSDASGLTAILLFGRTLLGYPYDDAALALLDGLAGLAALALKIPSGHATARDTGARPGDDAAPRQRAHSLASLRERHPVLAGMMGESAAVLETAQDLITASHTRFPVLITGESGVGKEVAAQALHRLSDRASGPFQVVDCGSIPRELIESELFGHVRGAFTGAHKDRRGAFEMAHRGTLFLDEIGDMPLQLQTRLLRVVQEGSIRRVGDETAIEVDVRIVAATHRDLKAAVLEKRFREDLYYRLNVFALQIPPLRERFEDLRPLMLHFLKSQGRERGIREWQIEPEVIAALQCHRFPGNLRELVNLCATLTVRAGEDGVIRLDNLEQVWRRQHAGEPLPWQGGKLAAKPARVHHARIGAWVLERSRAARFNLIDAARDLQRQRQGGQRPPISERSALTYYLTGEILRALTESAGDEDVAARSVALEPDLVPRVASRVHRVCEALREADGQGSLRRAFGKLPAEYQPLLEPLSRILTKR